MPFDFTGKTVFVTGAATGIGRATAEAFAAAGAAVAVVDMNAAGAEKTAAVITQAGGRAIAITADVSKADEVNGAVERTVAELGGLDIAFNNAGVEQASTPLTDITDAEWDRLIRTDLSGVFYGMRAEIRAMRRSGRGGAIINTSSGAGVIGIPNQAVYAAAKHAVIGLSKSVALEVVTDGIRVNVVAPGMIHTSMMDRVSGGTDEGWKAIIDQEPIGRMGQPEEIAKAVLFLASEDSAFTVGHVLVADGGQTVG